MNFDKAIDKKSDINVKLISYNKDNPNYKVLELTKNAEGNWSKFEKTGGVFAHVAQQKTYIKSMENKTGQEVAKKGDVICMGVEGELWVQAADKFNKKYTKSSASETKQDDEGRVYNWYEVKKGNPVAALKMHVPFQVKTTWSDEPLNGKAGDYIVKNYSDINNPDPKDVWIVDKKIFEKTYKKF